jgi:hypothetical protein
MTYPNLDHINKFSGGVRLLDVTEAGLPILFEHQLDREATRMAATI